MKNLLLFLLLITAIPPASYAQSPSRSQAPQSQPTPQQLQTFRETFVNNVVKGCMNNPPKDVRNSSGYCQCYASAFGQRYQPQDLILISNIAGAAAQNAQVISIMMLPDIRSCKLKN